jgi:hypothetical protein
MESKRYERSGTVMSNQDKKKDELLTKLQKDWHQLDELASPPIPEARHIQEQLLTAKAATKKAFYKELALFIATALVILTAFTTIVLQAPAIFIVTQVSAIVIAPLVLLLLRKNKQQGSILS